jgi:hypothetical protein
MVNGQGHRERLQVEVRAYSPEDLGDAARRLQGDAGKTGGPTRPVPGDMAVALLSLLLSTSGWLGLHDGTRAAAVGWLTAPLPIRKSDEARALLVDARGLVGRMAEMATALDATMEAAGARLPPPTDSAATGPRPHAARRPVALGSRPSSTRPRGPFRFRCPLREWGRQNATVLGRGVGQRP